MAEDFKFDSKLLDRYLTSEVHEDVMDISRLFVDESKGHTSLKKFGAELFKEETKLDNIRTYHFGGPEANSIVDIDASTLSEARRRFKELFGSWPNDGSIEDLPL